MLPKWLIASTSCGSSILATFCRAYPKQFSMVKKLLDTLTSMERVNKAVKGGAKVETRSLLEELQVTKRNSGD